MVGRIVEIADDRRHLFVHRGFMVVKDTEGERKELGQVPLDDIAAVIANAHGLTYTNNLLVALAERGAPFVLCGANHNAIGMLLTLDGHHVQAKRIEAQWAAALPLHKRLWAAVVKCKLGACRTFPPSAQRLHPRQSAPNHRDLADEPLRSRRSRHRLPVTTVGGRMAAQ